MRHFDNEIRTEGGKVIEVGEDNVARNLGADLFGRAVPHKRKLKLLRRGCVVQDRLREVLAKVAVADDADATLRHVWVSRAISRDLRFVSSRD